MLGLARRNQARRPEAASNVTFVEANIVAVPLEDGIADCVISNCVLNLVPEADRPAVFAEAARLLRPGGRIAVSDVLARRPLPGALRESVALRVGCIAGAGTREEYVRWISEAGFCGEGAAWG